MHDDISDSCERRFKTMLFDLVCCSRQLQCAWFRLSLCFDVLVACGVAWLYRLVCACLDFLLQFTSLLPFTALSLFVTCNAVLDFAAGAFFHLLGILRIIECVPWGKQP